MKKQFAFLIFWMFIIRVVTGQIPQPLQAVPSPNAWSFTQYGKVPVSGFTGLPTISIPLHNMQYKDQEISASLSYNASGFRPDVHASWVGTGWNLNIGGVITRNINGLPDDYQYTMWDSCRCSPYVPDYPETFNLGFAIAPHNLEYTLPNLMNASSYFVNTTYSPFPTGAVPTWVKYPFPVPYRGEYWDVSCWITDKYWKGVRIPASEAPEFTYSMYTGTKDLQSDEYSFNVMGYSGKFYFTSQSGITVISDQKFKVSSMGLQDIPAELWQPNSSSQAGASCTHWITGFSPYRAMGKYPKAFRGFIMEAEDRTQFIFGNMEYWRDAVEYSISEPYTPGEAGIGAQSPQDHWVANAWYLTSIVFPDGRVIDFDYQRGEYQRNLFTSEFSFGVEQNNPNCQAASAGYTHTGTLASRITSPVYLKQITGELLEAHFSWSNTNETNKLNEVSASIMKWKKLDEISFKDHEGKEFKWVFNYFPLSSRSQRLFLKEVEKLTKDNIPLKEKYSLLYDTSLVLPNYNMGQNDHWGFWNGVSSAIANGTTNEQMDVLRSPDFAKTQAGVLKRIVFPTGGYNEFTYEQNMYRKRVKLQRDQGTEDVGLNKNAGGLRIRSVIAHDPMANKTTTTDYLYVSGYTPSLTPAQIAQLPSSGVLNQHSYIYHWDQVVANMYTYESCLQDVKLRITSNQSLSPLMDDYHVGYSTVIEKYGDGSYKKLTFSNHDNGHPDDSAIGGINTFSSPYNKFSSRAIERGKVKMEEIYSGANKLLSSNQYDFSPISSDLLPEPKSHFTRFTINLLDATKQSGVNAAYSTIPLSYLLSNRFKEYTYFFLPTRIISKTWDQGNNNYLTTIKDIQYSGNNPTVITTTTPEGKILKEINRYPEHISGGGLMMAMLRNTPNTLVEKITTMKEDSSGTEKVTSAILNEFYQNPFSQYSKPVLKHSYSLAIANPVPLTNLTTTVAKDLIFASSDFWTKDSRYVLQNQSRLFDRFQNPLVNSLRSGLQSGIFKGYNDLRVTATLACAGGTFYHMSATSFEQQSVLKLIEGSNFTQTVFDSDQWILEGTRNETDVFTGAYSFVGRVRYKDYVIAGAFLVTAKSGGPAPTLERYDNATSSYTTINIVPKVIAESSGWKTYCFDYSNAGTLIAVNSNGNVIDDVIIGPYNAKYEDISIYSYNSGLLKEITNVNHKKTFFEYDVIGRLKVIKDQDKKVVKVFDYQFQAPNHANSIWETTGNKRCKPCAQNPAYSTNIQQQEEIDNNPQSDTYNQTRWTDFGVNATCVISPDWQYTNTALRCRQISGYNTGEREREQKDNNPCSPTFNTLRWIAADTNLNNCPLPPLYPVLRFNNTSVVGTTSSSDMYIDIYANAAHTVPLSAYNLTVNFKSERRRGDGSLVATNTSSVVCNGHETYVGRVHINTFGRDGETIILHTTYTLTSGSGYVAP